MGLCPAVERAIIIRRRFYRLAIIRKRGKHEEMETDTRSPIIAIVEIFKLRSTPY